MTTASLFGLNTVLGVSGILLVLADGSAMASTVTTSSVNLPNGYTTINIVDQTQTIDGGGSNTGLGTIGLQTNIGALNAYCVDLFDYISTGNNAYNFNQNALTAGSTFSNGSAPGTFTQAQVNVLTALLTNGSLQTQNTINTAALQIAIWATEYDTAAANGSYNITAVGSFYFTATNDSNSAAALTQAQAYLNDATGYQNGSTWVAASWLSNSSHFVEYLTSNPTGTQNLIYLATPEPSSLLQLGIGIAAVWRARRRKMRST
jgi:hypothetical protein